MNRRYIRHLDYICVSLWSVANVAFIAVRATTDGRLLGQSIDLFGFGPTVKLAIFMFTVIFTDLSTMYLLTKIRTKTITYECRTQFDP